MAGCASGALEGPRLTDCRASLPRHCRPEWRISVITGAGPVALVCGHVLSAQKPRMSCPAEPSGWLLVDRDAWWDITVAGFETEGITVYGEFGEFTLEFDDAAAALGFADGAAPEAFVREDQWELLDRNRNRPISFEASMSARPRLGVPRQRQHSGSFLISAARAARRGRLRRFRDPHRRRLGNSPPGPPRLRNARSSRAPPRHRAPR